MKYDLTKHHRRSIRLKGYDYAQPGAYFITICAYQRMHVFGGGDKRRNGLNDIGKIARDGWFKTAKLRPYVKLYDDEFVLMPDHGRGIIWIVDDIGGPRRRRVPVETTKSFGKPVKGSIPTIVRAYKSAVTCAVSAAENQRGAVSWQRNYYEHIVRSDREWNAIRRYIIGNPLSWQPDRDNLENLRKLPPLEKVEDYLEDLKEQDLRRTRFYSANPRNLR